MGRDGDKDASRDVGSSSKNAALLVTDGLLESSLIGTFFIPIFHQLV